MILSDMLAPEGLPLLPAMALAGIVAPLEKAHFLAQVAHESGGFRRLRENLNYSAQQLLRTWPARFTAELALQFAHKPERIANKVYGGRLGNGPASSGDGWRFIGRGFIQITGRENYTACSQRLYHDDRLVKNPALLEDPNIAAAAACDYWVSRHLGIHAAKDDLASVRRGVNGGAIGLDDCRTYLLRFKANLGIA